MHKRYDNPKTEMRFPQSIYRQTELFQSHLCQFSLFLCNIYCTLCFVLLHIMRKLLTFTSCFVRYTSLVPCWTTLCLQNCLNFSWYKFKNVLQTFLRDFGSYWHNSVTLLLQICRLKIHYVNLPLHCNPIELRSAPNFTENN